MTALVDTSALYSLVNGDDDGHEAAVAYFADDGIELVTHRFVVVEATALLQRRLGLEPVQRMHLDVLADVAVRGPDDATFDAAVAALLAAERRSVSLVDRISFEVMRREGITEAFAFDDDFTDAGFSVRP